MALLERAHLLAALDEELAAALSGAGRLVLVTGEAGIGKTSLIAEFQQRHATQVRILCGQCDPVAAPRPLGPIHDFAPDVGLPTPPHSDDRFAAWSAITALVTEQPTVIIVEDAHWADGATLDLLVHLARRIRDLSLLLVVTFRSDEVDAEHPLRIALGRIAGAPQRRLSVPALSLNALTQLVSGTEVDPQRLLAVTGGNPFYATEVLATGFERLPETVVDSVLARASRLSAPARGALEIVSVMPGGAVWASLRAMTTGAAIDECIAAGLIVAGEKRLSMRHELARLAVEQAVPPAHAREIHRRVLGVLEGLPDTDPSELALHADAAGDPDAVLRHGPVAARRAARLGANRAAAAHYSSVLAHVGRSPSSMRAEALEGYGEAVANIGEAATAVSSLNAAAEVWDDLQEPVRAGRARVRSARHLWSAGHGPAAREKIDAAVAALEAAGGAAFADGLALQAQLRMLARDSAGAIAAGRQAIEVAEPLQEHAILSRAHNAVGSAMWFVRPDEAEPLLETCLEHAHAAAAPELVASALVNLGSGAGEIRRYETANRWLDAAIEWCGARDLDANGDYARAWRARTALEQGDWSTASQLAGQVVSRPTNAISRIVALTVLGLLRCRRGDPGAEAALDEAWRLAEETADLQRIWPVAAARAELDFWLGGNVGYVDELRAALDLAVAAGHGWAIGELGTWLRRAGVEISRTHASGPYLPWLERRFDDAAAQWHALGCPFDRLLVLADEGSTTSLRQGLEIALTLGAAPVAARLQARLRGLGAAGIPRGPRSSTTRHPAGLTARQAEVLDLVCAGHTNAQIARQLVLSIRTVDHHVSAILQKLGVTSREEAINAASALLKQGV